MATMTFDNKVELHKVQLFTSFLLTSFFVPLFPSHCFFLLFVPLTLFSFFVPLTFFLLFLSLSLFFSSFLSLTIFSFCPSLFFSFFVPHCFFFFFVTLTVFSFFCHSHCFFPYFVPPTVFFLIFLSLSLCLSLPSIFVCPSLLFNSSSSTSFFTSPLRHFNFLPTPFTNPETHTASFPSFSLISSIFHCFFFFFCPSHCFFPSFFVPLTVFLLFLYLRFFSSFFVRLSF